MTWDCGGSGWDNAHPQGMPGIGKTTSIHCLAHALLGDAYKEGVLELNASDERWAGALRTSDESLISQRNRRRPE